MCHLLVSHVRRILPPIIFSTFTFFSLRVMNFGFLISAKIKLVFNSALFLSLGDKIKRGKQEGHGNTEQWGQRDTK